MAKFSDLWCGDVTSKAAPILVDERNVFCLAEMVARVGGLINYGNSYDLKYCEYVLVYLLFISSFVWCLLL